ncbi:MAG: amidohydrolase family protein [Burkholderiales bacterium]|nr:amidohydrolase family protein [Phycisphaerae bacterium]
MRIDCHVHLSGFTPGHGALSPRLLRSPQFRFLRWKFGIGEVGSQAELDLERLLISQLDSTPEIDAAVVLAFDAVYDKSGTRLDADTHFFVENDYVMEIAARNRKVLFGVSVHPYRRDAIAELERCVNRGAVLVKWLPITQGIDPSDRRCFEFYEALAHHKIPLLSHTGGEMMLPNVNQCADPVLLLPALRRGVTVIAAHCGTRSSPFGNDYVRQFVKMAIEHERFYGDTAALNLPARWHAYGSIFDDQRVMAKVVHGSDWAVMPIPPVARLGLSRSVQLMEEENWLRRDVLIKQAIGFDEAYWNRCATLLRITVPEHGHVAPHA